MVTFAQFLCIALEGLYMHLDWPKAPRLTPRGGPDKPATSTASLVTGWLPQLRERVIPLGHYVAMVAIFFTVSTLNNAALGYQISLPLHMVFRSGSLIATALIGRLFFKEVCVPLHVSCVSCVCRVCRVCVCRVTESCD